MKKNRLGIVFCLLCVLLVIAFTSGCTGKEKKGELLVSGKSLSIKQEDFYAYMKSSRGISDMEKYSTLLLMRNQYPIDTAILDEALKVEKMRYIDFDKTIEAQNKTEFEIRNQLEIELMFREAIMEENKVSTETLKIYYETWVPNLVAHQMAVENKDVAAKIKEELENGESFSKILVKYKKETKLGVENKLELGEDSYMDDSIQEVLQSIQKVGEVSIVEIDAYFWVYQLVYTGKKATFEEDKEQVKASYLETQFTSYNREKVLRKIVLAEKLNIHNSYFDDLFKQLTAEEISN